MKSSFKQSFSIQPIFTGGTVCLDQGLLYAPVHTTVAVTDWNSGIVQQTLDPKADGITCVAVGLSYVVVATQSLLLVAYEKGSDVPVYSFKAHYAPVLAMAWDPSSTYLATGSADSTVKIWNIASKFCTHNFKGHGGIITSVAFHPTPGKLELYSASEDGTIKVWDTISKTCKATLSGHVSAVRALDFAPDAKYLVSCARDKVINVWDIEKMECISTVPLYEFVETCGFIHSDLVYAGGELGQVSVFNWKTGQKKFSFFADGSADAQKHHSIVGSIHLKDVHQLICITEDQNFCVFDITNVGTSEVIKSRHLVGYNEEILDFALLGSKLAVASNSEQIRIYNTSTSDCIPLDGHQGIVYCIDSFESTLVSGSKDNSARVWRQTAGGFECVAVCLGHTESIGAVAIGKKSGRCFLSASQDRTIKCWNLQDIRESPSAAFTVLAHEKDINSLQIAPNEKIFASCSQDKTAKLWDMISGSLLGVFKGHKRGVWSVCFSPVDRVLATSSGDKTIKIWALNDFSCLKTFEGHLNTVLRVNFLSAGLQLVSAGADGLVKLWNVKTNECSGTFDAHDDKIWALAVQKDEQFIITGGGDSKVIIWEDCTAAELEEARAIEEKGIIEQQHLNTYIAKKDYKRALSLALSLDRPVHLLNMLTVISKNIEIEGIVQNLVESLGDESLEKLLTFVRDWNTSARNCEISQLVLQVVLKNVSFDRLLGLGSIKVLLEGLISYTDRHYGRVKRTLIQSKIIDF